MQRSGAKLSFVFPIMSESQADSLYALVFSFSLYLWPFSSARLAGGASPLPGIELRTKGRQNISSVYSYDTASTTHLMKGDKRCCYCRGRREGEKVNNDKNNKKRKL